MTKLHRLEQEISDSLDRSVRGMIEMKAEIDRLRALVRNAAKGLKIIAETNLPRDVASLHMDFDRAKAIAECALAAIPEDDR